MLKKNLNLKIGLVVFFLGLFLFHVTFTCTCFSLPVPEEVASGSAEFIYPDASTLQINASDKAIINYQSFDIGLNESVIINLPQVSNEVLNRVLGNTASQIQGSLTCNGIFILVNKNGIFFGPNSQVDVGSLIASTRDITDSDFLGSKYIFGKMSVNQLYKLIRNQGNINIKKGGFGVLISGAIDNSGTIIAPLGTVALAGADMVTLEVAGEGLISVAIDRPTAEHVYDQNGNPVTDQIKNTGTLQADGGVVLLKAEALPGLFEKAINLEGYVKADKLEGKDGTIKIISSGKVSVNSQVTATNIVIGKEDEAVPVEVEMNTGTLTADTLSVAAERLSVNSASLLTEIYKTGDISLTSANIQDNLVTLEGDGIKVTYLKNNNLTLKTDNSIDTTTGLVIQANQLKLAARQFGSLDIPLNLEANTTYIKRIDGNIEIMDSLGIGSSIMLRGPPEGFGAISYNKDTSLTLEAAKVVLSSEAPTYFYGDITFYNFECKVPDKEIYFEAGHTYTFKGLTYIKGLPDDGENERMIKLYSQQAGQKWYLNLQSDTYTLDLLNIKDCSSLSYLFIPVGIDSGNNYNLYIDPEWDGEGADNNWSTANNWVGNAVPTGTEAVTFSGDELTYPNADKNCTIDNVGAWSGGNLTITSAYTGTITKNVAITVNNFSMAGGTFNAGSTNMTAQGTFTLSGGSFTSTSGVLIIQDTFTKSGGTFTHNSGTVRFNALTDYTVTAGGTTFYNVQITKTTGATIKTITLADNFTVAGDLTIGNISSADFYVYGSGNPTITVSGNINFSSTAQTVASYFGNSSNNFTVNLAGDFSIADAEAYMYANLTFNGGAVTQNITQSAGTISTGTWTINKPSALAPAQLASALTIGGNLTTSSSSSTLYTAGFNLTVSGTFSNTGALKLLGSETIILTMDTDSGVVNYAGTGSYTGLKAGNNYYQLSFSAAGAWTLNADLDVNGNLTMTAGSLTCGNYNVNLGGTLINWGGTFSSTGTVTFDGASGGISETSSTIFNNLTFNNASGSWTLTTFGGLSLDVNGNLTITSGAFDLSGYNLDLTGSFSNNGTLKLKGTETLTGFVNDTDSGTVEYAGNDETVTGLKAGNAYYNLTFSGTKVYYLNADLDVNNNLTISNGSVYLNWGGFYDVNIGGSLDISALGGMPQSNTNTIYFDGVSTGKTITLNATELAYVVFNGIGGEWTLQDELTCSDLTITNGTLIGGSNNMYIGYGLSNSGTFTTSGTITFNSVMSGGNIRSNGTSFYNLIFNGGGSTWTLQDALDVDNNLTISAGTLDISASNYQINVGGDCSNSGSFNARNGTVVFDKASGTQTLNSGGSSFYRITHSGAGTLQLSTTSLAVTNSFTNSAGTFDLNGQNWTMTGATFSNDGTLKLIGTETLTGFTNDTDSGTVQYNGSGAITGLKAGNTYNNLSIIGSATYTLNAALDVNNNLTVVTVGGGSLACGNYSVNIGGSLLGSNFTTSGTFIFDATTTGKTITSGGATFNHLTFNGVGGSWKPNSPLDINGNLTITNGTLDLNDYSIDLAGTFTNNDTLKLIGSETLTGFTNDTDSGTVEYYGTGSYTGLKAGNSYNNLAISGSGTYTLNAALDVNNNLTISNGTLAAGSYAVSIGGNFSNAASFTTSGTVTFDATTTGKTITSGGVSFYNLTLNGVGGGWTLQDALDVNGNLSLAAGALSANAQAINVAGNWSNSGGTFTHGNNTMTFDGSSSSSLSGSNSFYNLSCITAGKSLSFAAGSTQTIAGTLTLTGASGNLIALRSSSAGTQWNINPQGTISISYVDIKDSYNLNLVTISPLNSTDSGNNNYWFSVTITQPEVEEATKVVDNAIPAVETIIAVETGIETGGSPSENINLEISPAPLTEEEPVVTENPSPVQENTPTQATAEPQASEAPAEEATPEEETKPTESQEATEESAPEKEAEPEAKEELKEENKEEENDKGFDYDLAYKEDKGKYAKPYTSGKYKTTVVVFEGKVLVGQYDEAGVKEDKTLTLTGGQKTTQEAEINSEDKEPRAPAEELKPDKENQVKENIETEEKKESEDAHKKEDDSKENTEHKEIAPEAKEKEPVKEEKIDSGFDFGLIYEEATAKYSRPYIPGQYKTTVLVFEGRVAVGAYDDAGIKEQQIMTLSGGQKTIQEGWIK